MATISKKKKKVKVTPEGAVHIKASFNNIMVTIT
ncbi:MAG: 30S ribosomal protein S11, partial [Pelodictyon phaeoclathratiforme]